MNILTPKLIEFLEKNITSKLIILNNPKFL